MMISNFNLYSGWELMRFIDTDVITDAGHKPASVKKQVYSGFQCQCFLTDVLLGSKRLDSHVGRQTLAFLEFQPMLRGKMFQCIASVLTLTLNDLRDTDTKFDVIVLQSFALQNC